VVKWPLQPDGKLQLVAVADEGAYLVHLGSVPRGQCLGVHGLLQRVELVHEQRRGAVEPGHLLVDLQ
jgi:hypothetical protein